MCSFGVPPASRPNDVGRMLQRAIPIELLLQALARPHLNLAQKRRTESANRACDSFAVRASQATGGTHPLAGGGKCEVLRANIGKLQKSHFRIKEAPPSQSLALTYEPVSVPDPLLGPTTVRSNASPQRRLAAAEDGNAPERNAATMFSYVKVNEDRSSMDWSEEPLNGMCPQYERCQPVRLCSGTHGSTVTDDLGGHFPSEGEHHIPIS